MYSHPVDKQIWVKINDSGYIQSVVYVTVGVIHELPLLYL